MHVHVNNTRRTGSSSWTLREGEGIGSDRSMRCAASACGTSTSRGEDVVAVFASTRWSGRGEALALRFRSGKRETCRG